MASLCIGLLISFDVVCSLERAPYILIVTTITTSVLQIVFCVYRLVSLTVPSEAGWDALEEVLVQNRPSVVDPILSILWGRGDGMQPNILIK
jgi:hypothetical protein